MIGHTEFVVGLFEFSFYQRTQPNRCPLPPPQLVWSVHYVYFHGVPNIPWVFWRGSNGAKIIYFFRKWAEIWDLRENSFVALFVGPPLPAWGCRRSEGHRSWMLEGTAGDKVASVSEITADEPAWDCHILQPPGFCVVKMWTIVWDQWQTIY